MTDTAESTEKWEKKPHEMAAARARHNALIDALVAKNRGTIQDWAGDGVFARFHTGNPLQCALDIQRALQDEDWEAVGGLSVRIGVHCGPGSAPGQDQANVNRTRRITDSAWGGQVVVSAAAAGSLPMPDAAELADLGLCRLRGIDAPMRLFGLLHPDLERTEFPPLRTLSHHGATIAAQVAPIYGREQELANIVAGLSGAARQWTIIGAGGNGKTRLAIEVGATLSNTMPVYFASLEGGDVGELAGRLGRALRVPFHRRASEQEQLILYLRDKHALIIVDNADRLPGHGAFLQEIVRSCPGLRLLVTSREPLMIQGEKVLRLQGLRPPHRNDPAFRETPAARLFIEAARNAVGTFELKNEDAAAFGEICELVGGSPLALHLTAQWTHLLSLEEILARLRGGLSFIAGLSAEGARSPLESVFEGSAALLSKDQQRALARLSVFRGGFEVRAAEAAAAVPVELLGLLERKCLLERREHRRFVMHPLILEYSRARTSADELAAIEQRHSAYYLDFVRQSFAAAKGRDQGLVLDRLEGDLANIRAAWEFALQAEDYTDLRSTIEPLFYVLALRALLHDCVALVSVKVADPALQTMFDAICANCLVHQGDFEGARVAAERALQHVNLDGRAAAHCRHALAGIAHAEGDLAHARGLYELALAERAKSGDLMGVYYSGLSLAFLEVEAKNFDAARQRLQEGHSVVQRAAHWGGRLMIHMCAGDLAVREERFANARQNYQKALEIEESVRNPQLRAATLIKFGQACVELGELERAEAAFEEASAIAHQLGDLRIAINADLALARNRRRRGEPGQARAVLQLALERARRLGSVQQLVAALAELAYVELDLGELAAARRAAVLLRAFGEGALMGEYEPLLRDAPHLFEDLEVAASPHELLLQTIQERDFGRLSL